MSKRKQRSWRNRRKGQSRNFFGRATQVAQFQQNLQTSTLDPYLIFNISGQGGVGKTELLHQFTDFATMQGYVVAELDKITDLLSGMKQLADQLADKGYACNNFSKRYQTYVTKQQELEKEIGNMGVYGHAAKTLVKTGFAVGKTLNPTLGNTAAILLDEQKIADFAGQLMTYARKKLQQDEADLLLDPVGQLTPLLLSDLKRIANETPLLLGFDTYEQTGVHLDDWLRSLLEEHYGELPEEMTWVIAGREPLDSNRWAKYMYIINHMPLEPFTEKVAIDYLVERGVSDEEVINLILDISKRLPLLLAMLAQNAPQSINEVREVSSNAVERFLYWVNDPTKQELAKHAAVPRLLNQDVVAILLKNKENEGVSDLFTWLTTMPFMLERADGWRYHNVVRSQMLRYLHRISRQQLGMYHEYLMNFYSAQRSKLGLEFEDGVNDYTWLILAQEESYHRLSYKPHEGLPALVREILKLIDKKISVVRNWSAIVTQVGEETNSHILQKWGTTIEAGLEGIEKGLVDKKKQQATINFLTECINLLPADSPSLAIAFRTRGVHRHLLLLTTKINSTPAFSADFFLELLESASTDTLRNEHEEIRILDDFNQALEHDPENILALVYRSNISLGTNRYDQAIRDLNIALKLNTNDNMRLLIFGLRSLCHIGLEKPQEAFADLDECLLQLSNAANVQIEHRNVIADFRNLIKGIASPEIFEENFEKNLLDLRSTFNSNFITTEHGRKFLLTQADFDNMLGNYKLSLHSLNTLLDTEPENSSIVAKRGETYRLMKEYDKAISDFDHAIKLDPDYSVALVERGKTYRLMGQYEQALPDFDRAIKLNPDWDVAYADRGKTYRLMGQYEQALPDFDRAIKLNPAWDVAYAGRGKTYLLMGQYEQALPDFDRAIELDPDYAWAWASRGQTYQQMGKYEQALPDFDRALELSPDYAWALSGRAETHLLLGHDDQARQDVDQAIAAGSQSDWVHYLHHLALHRLGKTVEAEVALDTAVSRLEAQLNHEEDREEQLRLKFNQTLYLLAQGHQVAECKATYETLLAEQPSRGLLQDTWRDVRDYGVLMGTTTAVADIQDRLQRALDEYGKT